MSGRASWRGSRPFWGGLLTLLAGLELLSIPFATKALPLVIQSGTVGGTYLIGLLMVIVALLLWLQPGQRVFLGVVAVLVSIASFVYANLGGFLIGMLLGLVGGALAAAWTPVGSPGDGTAPADPGSGATFTGRRVVRAGEQAEPPARRPAAGDSPRVLVARLRDNDETPPTERTGRGDEPTDDNPDGEGDAGGGPGGMGGPKDPKGPGVPGGPGGKVMAMAVLPAVLLAGGGTAGDGPRPVDPLAPVEAVATALPPALPPLLPSAIPSIPRVLPSVLPSALPGAGGAGTPGPSPSGDAAVPEGAALSPRAVAVEAASVRAPSLTMTGMKFQGVVEMPTASGTVKMLRFTMDRAVLDRPQQTMGRATLTGMSFTFEGDVVICTTRMTGKLLGLPQEFTAEHPNVLVRALKLVPSLSVPLTMTDIVSEQPYVSADSLRADDLRLVVS
ncbi:DUF6114 domain-containing protein [Microbispora sp. NPDC049125]|uniref:DUF6114 domain-containing protein n=1 Tax=Microbispora sp. NPDC049125 TaxID=3154929 RepID=UPI0034654787